MVYLLIYLVVFAVLILFMMSRDSEPQFDKAKQAYENERTVENFRELAKSLKNQTKKKNV